MGERTSGVVYSKAHTHKYNEYNYLLWKRIEIINLSFQYAGNE